MPGKECSVMDERMRFVIRLKDGESMASLCREFGISRKTGYKIMDRYKECGLEGLSDRSRRPLRYANQLPEPVEAAIVAVRREKPNWGARKIRERLLRRLPHAVKVPACSTIHAVLDRHGLVTRATRSRTRAEGTPLSEGLRPNDLWCTDYKGEFMLADQCYCYPLTVTDHAPHRPQGSAGISRCVSCPAAPHCAFCPTTMETCRPSRVPPGPPGFRRGARIVVTAA
jgi:transposase